ASSQPCAPAPARSEPRLTAPATTFADGQRLCDSPLIHVFDDMIAPEECAHIVAAARPQMRRSQVSGAEGGKLSPGRTSARAWLKHALDPTVHAVASRIAGRVGLPLAHAESLQ